MKKNIKHFLFLTALSAGALHVTNRFIDMRACMKNLLSTDGGDFYKWKNGDIYYSKSGSGSPILLVHDLDPASSSYEWCKLIKKLEKKHTVYTIDLLGCGRSEKPYLTYTNYLYVQLLLDFIKNVIKEKTTVVATGSSAPFTIMAANMESEQFENLIFINPQSLQACDRTPERMTRIQKCLLELPIVGTFAYNMMMSHCTIDENFRNTYFARPQLISSKLEDLYFESAHANQSHGKYLLASILGNYTTISIKHVLSKLDVPVMLIGGRNCKDSASILESYVHYNSSFETVTLSNCKMLPQLETPDRILAILDSVLNE